MTIKPRRSFLRASSAGLGAWLSGCGGGSSSAAAPEAAAVAPALAPIVTPVVTPPVVAPPVVNPVAQAAQAYRNQQPRLFQSVPTKLLTSRLPGGRDLIWDVFGPTREFVDFQTGWRWAHAGGDWLDADQVSQGNRPWFSIASDAASGATAVASYQGDVTAAVQFVQTQGRWCAFLLDARSGPRKIATPLHASHAAPAIDVRYADGSSARLPCRIVAINSASSTGPNCTDSEMTLPVFIEFDRPAAPVASASLSYVLTQHWSGAKPTVAGFVLDPPVTAGTPRSGSAGLAGRLDEGIDAQPAVIGAHRYLDGLPLSGFVHTGASNFSAEMNYDPAIFGNGPTDLSRFPHAGLGKWVNADPAWSLVQSNYRGEGYAPLAPGLAALRIHMPAAAGVHDGSTVGSSGSLAGNGYLHMPEPLFGRLDRIFVRYYFRLGSPLKPTSQNRYHVYSAGSATDWTSHSGKFGIGPDHVTAYGGVSGSSGGPNGWQMRLGWSECDAGQGGPDEAGWAPGFHLYDFYYQNPPGHNYGAEISANERWGQRGGQGGMLYTDRWYCIETEMHLNTVMNSGPGYVPDGALRAWVDGRLVFERTGMVFRTGPITAAAYRGGHLRPCRELGVRGLWLNWYHGGKTVATIDRTSFYTGLVWSREYIGPMTL